MTFPDVTLADVTLGIFTFFNSLRFLAYVPQIARVLRDNSGAEAISFGTWGLFLVSHTSAMAYAIENQGDWTMASVFLGNALGCATILVLAGWKRTRHRRRRNAAAPHERARSTGAVTSPPWWAWRKFAGIISHDAPMRLAGGRARRQDAPRLAGDFTMTNDNEAQPRDERRIERLQALALLLAGVTLVISAVAESLPGIVGLTPPEIIYSSRGSYVANGVEQTNLIGDPAKPGPYTIRLKFAKGVKIAPHSHPDAREVTILSGVFATGYGDTFDTRKLKVLPAGSFYTEPAGVPHFIEVKEETVLQVTGIGPSARDFVHSHPDTQ